MEQGTARGGVLHGSSARDGWHGPRAVVGGCARGPRRAGVPRGVRGGTGVCAGRAAGGGSGGGGGKGAGSAAYGSTGYGARASGVAGGPLQAPGDGLPQSAEGGAGLADMGVAGEGLKAGKPEEGASLSYSQIRSPGGRMN